MTMAMTVFVTVNGPLLMSSHLPAMSHPTVNLTADATSDEKEASEEDTGEEILTLIEL
jgi:hypothetical protein